MAHAGPVSSTTIDDASDTIYMGLCHTKVSPAPPALSKYSVNAGHDEVSSDEQAVEFTHGNGLTDIGTFRPERATRTKTARSKQNSTKENTTDDPMMAALASLKQDAVSTKRKPAQPSRNVVENL